VDTQSDYPCGVGLGPYTHRLKQSLLIIMSVRETTVSIIVLRGLTRERKSTDEDTFAAGMVVSLRLRSPRKETTMLSTELRGVGQTPILSYSPVVLMNHYLILRGMPSSRLSRRLVTPSLKRRCTR
jgi:hypothetical protein